MAFLPALHPGNNDKSETTSWRKSTRNEENDRKKYRLSLSNAGKKSTKLPRLPPLPDSKAHQVASSELSIDLFSNIHQKDYVCEKKSKSSIKLEPIKMKCPPSKISQSKLVWIEPFGLWVSRKKARKLYEKFCNQIQLVCKEPDYFVDPCPHIPRCDHAGTWSAVRLERQKFRELSQMRNDQLFQRTLEKYRDMQGLWLQQLNNLNNIEQATSAQTRLENFRKFAGANFHPLDEIQRLDRLKARHREWQEAWELQNEQRENNSTRKPPRLFPRILVTDYDTNCNVTERNTTMTSSELDILSGHMSRELMDHVQYSSCDIFGDTYEALGTLVDCCSQLEGRMVAMVEGGIGTNTAETQVGVVHETKHERYAEMRTTQRIFRPYERTKRLSDHELNINSRNSKMGCVNSDNDPSLCDSTEESRNGLKSNSIEDLTNISKRNIEVGAMLLDTTIRQADNTAGLMGHLVPVPLGIGSWKIPNENITASSELDVYHAASQARLHNEKKGSNGGSWMPRLQDPDPYIQVDLGVISTVQQVATQGNPQSAVKEKRHKRWVTQFSLAFSKDGKEWHDYEESGSVKIFSGNCDTDTAVINSLQRPVETRFVRFKPKKWHKGIAMRVEVFGPQPAADKIEHDQEPEEQTENLPEAETKDENEQGSFVLIEEYCKQNDFDEIEERIVSPVVPRSPPPLLVSPSTPYVTQKVLLQSKFCVNHLPIVTQSEMEPRNEDANNEDTTDNAQCQEEEDDSEENELTSSDHTADEPSPDAGTSATDDVLRAQAERLRRLERARADNSIKRQLMRERIAEERRRKLDLLTSQKMERSMEEHLDDTGDIYGLGSFLEKYCIIAQPDKVIYQGVFDKFDEDEDGFLWPEECLDALKDVNTNLLVDSHLKYVYRILELCDSHAESGTGLRLFSVIAALSRRVVALNAKMKHLISQCNFKTIDCTLLRAKMLFECYVNEDTKTISRKDLWVGLAAGGLCHADETMEDYFGDRQSFDFLDFLTYLPLFQLIHGNVIENPLSVF